MNKKHIGWLLAIPVFMGLGLTSCSSEEPISKVQNIPTEKVDVTLIAHLPNSTRASLTFNDEKALKFAWDKDDKIKAVNADNGAYIGTLTASEVKEDPHFCVFSGKLNLPATGTANLKFYYLGEKGQMSFDADGNIADLFVDHSQQNGTAGELDDYDILQANKEYNCCCTGQSHSTALKKTKTTSSVGKCSFKAVE